MLNTFFTASPTFLVKCQLPAACTAAGSALVTKRNNLYNNLSLPLQFLDDALTAHQLYAFLYLLSGKNPSLLIFCHIAHFYSKTSSLQSNPGFVSENQQINYFFVIIDIKTEARVITY